MKPQDAASLPKGQRGNAYNAVPACDLVDWPLVHQVVGSQFQYEENYDAPHESRFCASLSAGQSTGDFLLRHGISKSDTAKLMSVALARAQAYFAAYHR